jgi:hypothetical protein
VSEFCGPDVARTLLETLLSDTVRACVLNGRAEGLNSVYICGSLVTPQLVKEEITKEFARYAMVCKYVSNKVGTIAYVYPLRACHLFWYIH